MILVRAAIYLFAQAFLFFTYLASLYASCVLVEPLPTIRRLIDSPTLVGADVAYTTALLTESVLVRAGLRGNDTCLSRHARQHLWSYTATRDWCASDYPPHERRCVVWPDGEERATTTTTTRQEV